MNSILFCHDAVLGEEYQMVAIRVKQHTQIIHSLITVIQYASDELPSPHISQPYGRSQNRTCHEGRKVFPIIQEENRKRAGISSRRESAARETEHYIPQTATNSPLGILTQRTISKPLTVTKLHFTGKTYGCTSVPTFSPRMSLVRLPR